MEASRAQTPWWGRDSGGTAARLWPDAGWRSMGNERKTTKSALEEVAPGGVSRSLLVGAGVSELA